MDNLEEPKEEGVRTPDKVVSEKIESFRSNLSPAAVELLEADFSQKKDYKVEVIDNPYVIGQVQMVESWNDTYGPANRRVVVYDDRYKPRDEFDSKQGDFSIGVSGRLGSIGSEVTIGFNVNAKGEAKQSIRCSVDEAQRSTSFGREPLMKGNKFFEYAKRSYNNQYPVDVTEDITINSDGEVSSSKYFIEDYRVPGSYRDEYRLKLVEEVNGKVKVGSMTHGIGLGYHPKMETVN